jgi:uncharacterized protein (TIGR00645 family)
MSKPLNVLERSIFASRWMLAATSLGLSWGLALYLYKFCQELWHMTSEIGELSSEKTMLYLLGLVDIAMLSNLVVMISIGGYSIFVREIDPKMITNRPRFMNHITASGLKVKMGSSLIGVSSIHLLKQFVETSEASNIDASSWHKIGILVLVHLVFVVSTVALAYIDKPHPVSEIKVNNS